MQPRADRRGHWQLQLATASRGREASPNYAASCDRESRCRQAAAQEKSTFSGLRAPATNKFKTGYRVSL